MPHLIDISRSRMNEDKEFLALGDTNPCSEQMNEPGYIDSSLSEIVNNFNIEEDCQQLIESYTRIRNVHSSMQRWCLDPIIVNCLSKMT